MLHRAARRFSDRLFHLRGAASRTDDKSVRPLSTHLVVGERLVGHKLSAGYDQHVVADLGDLREDVAADDDGVLLGKTSDEVPNLDDLLRVEADGRLVENDDVGVAEHRLGDPHTLSVSL